MNLNKNNEGSRVLNSQDIGGDDPYMMVGHMNS